MLRNNRLLRISARNHFRRVHVPFRITHRPRLILNPTALARMRTSFIAVSYFIGGLAAYAGNSGWRRTAGYSPHRGSRTALLSALLAW
jgi:hypothetical protein